MNHTVEDNAAVELAILRERVAQVLADMQFMKGEWLVDSVIARLSAPIPGLEVEQPIPRVTK